MSATLSQRLAQIAKEASGFTGERSLSQLSTPQEFDQVKASLSVDFRSPKVSLPGVASVLEGLEFDPLFVRSQAFFISEGQNELGIITFVIAPQGWIEQQRYLRVTSQGVEICGASKVRDGRTPNYFIIPGWTHFKESHRGEYALTALRFYERVLEEIVAAAPQNTWIELNPKGKHNLLSSPSFASMRLGDILPFSNLPFPLEDFGANAQGSASSVKMAMRLKLPKLSMVADARSLGPIFSRPLNNGH